MKKFSCKAMCLVLCTLFLISSFMGVTFAENSNEKKEKIMVSMGDSYSSGEGIEPFYGQELPLNKKNENIDWLAHRSKQSWPGMLVLDGKKMSENRDNNWYFVASSGAETKHILNEYQTKESVKHYMFDYDLKNKVDYIISTIAEKFAKFGKVITEGVIEYPLILADVENKLKRVWNDFDKKDGIRDDFYQTYKDIAQAGWLFGSCNLPPQIRVFSDYDLKDKVDYITITIGGNDAKFSEIITEGVIEHHFIFANVENKLKCVWNDFYKKDGIRENLYQTYKDIAAAAGLQVKIIVAGYPKLIDVDKSGGAIRRESSELINESVTRFNREIESVVNSCKAEGIKICFVSVEEEFDGHGMYSDNSYINDIIMLTMPEDLKDGAISSAYSVHPNLEGARAYARCVQAKIDAIEKDGGKSEWPEMFGSDKRDVVLLLDASGSMHGTPIEETKKAALKFINTTLREDVGIGTVIYDSSAQTIANINKNENYLKNTIQTISAGGETNIEAGLAQAKELFTKNKSNAKKKFIILMSDGEPTAGKVGTALVEYADSLKNEGFRIYTLGFFSALSSKTAPQALMEKIATDGCHYEVDDAEQLMFFFADIAEQMKGTKYYYIRIACPVDVTVSYNGEVLSSKAAYTNQRTSFGTMTFEDSTAQSYSYDNRIKTLRLKEGVNYDIKIEGNGEGYMSYTIGFMDEEGEYTDMRNFDNIRITRNTKIDTMAAYSDETTIKVDENGDGQYDYIYKATENSSGEKYDYKSRLMPLLIPVWILLFILAMIIFVKVMKKRKSF